MGAILAKFLLFVNIFMNIEKYFGFYSVILVIASLMDFNSSYYLV